jgi:hypothetical protein
MPIISKSTDRNKYRKPSKSPGQSLLKIISFPKGVSRSLSKVFHNMEMPIRIYKILKIYFVSLLDFFNQLDLLRKTEECHKLITSSNTCFLSEILELISKYFQKFLSMLKSLKNNPVFIQSTIHFQYLKTLKGICNGIFAKDRIQIQHIANGNFLFKDFRLKMAEKIFILENQTAIVKMEKIKIKDFLLKSIEKKSKLEEKIRELLK